MTKLLIVPLCFFMAYRAEAQHLPEDASHHYSDYYTIPETSAATEVSVDPATTMKELLTSSWGSALHAQVYNLLNFLHHQGDFGDTAQPYQRVRDFGTWVLDAADQDCYNTRAKILIRDSQAQVQFSSTGCTVTTGSWGDPYTGTTFDRAADVQIDHVVPLKNAYVSGAANWSFQKRCLYANFMGNDFHLLSVSGHENMKKGDGGPEDYMPPSANFQCEYLRDWVRIKFIWSLGLNPDEAKAVQQDVKDNNCDPQDFQFTEADLQQQKQFIQDHADLCAAP